MKLMDTVQAWIAASELQKEKLPYPLALALVKVRKATEDDALFFLGHERELALEYAKLDENGNLVMTGPGRFAVKDGKSLDEYERRRAELANTEVEKPLPRKLRVRPPEQIEPGILEALEPFIEFAE